MAEFWSSTEEVSKAVLGMLGKAYQDPVIKSKAAAMNNLLVFKYHDPDVQIWIDSRGGTLNYGSGDPPGHPDVQMSLSADDAHRTWSNKLNVMVAMTKRKVVISGNATKILKLTPLLKKFTEAYNEVLKEMGKESIILR